MTGITVIIIILVPIAFQVKTRVAELLDMLEEIRETLARIEDTLSERQPGP